MSCVRLTPANVHTIAWLPGTCAYRLVAERDLFQLASTGSGHPTACTGGRLDARPRHLLAEAEMGEPEDYLEHMLEEEP